MKQIRFRSLDGLKLFGVYQEAKGRKKGCAVMVHGISVDHTERGYFDLVADKLVARGVACFRLDWRAHGKSAGKQEEMTLTGIMADIYAAALQARKLSGEKKLCLLGASFSGGLTGALCACVPELARSVVLINPLLDYFDRMLVTNGYWSQNGLTPGAARSLNRKGYLTKPDSFVRLGREMINEFVFFRPLDALRQVKAPVLTIHGDKDDVVSCDVAKKWAKYNKRSRFMGVKDCKHGIGHYKEDPIKDAKIKNKVAEAIVRWFARNG